jgi:hypothetical protein
MARCNFTLAPGVTPERWAKVNWDLMLGHAITGRVAQKLMEVDIAESDRDCVFVPGRIGQVGDSVTAVARQRRKLGIPPHVPAADNRQRVRSPIESGAAPEIVAAVRRARRIGLADDQILYLFGALLRTH